MRSRRSSRERAGGCRRSSRVSVDTRRSWRRSYMSSGADFDLLKPTVFRLCSHMLVSLQVSVGVAAAAAQPAAAAALSG